MRYTQLDHHDADRNGRGCLHLRDQIRQRVSQPAQRRHQAADESAGERMAAAGQGAVVREGFGKTHADARTNAGGQADQESLPASWVAKAAAKMGASVETDPSMSPASPG